MWRLCGDCVATVWRLCGDRDLGNGQTAQSREWRQTCADMHVFINCPITCSNGYEVIRKETVRGAPENHDLVLNYQPPPKKNLMKQESNKPVILVPIAVQ